MNADMIEIGKIILEKSMNLTGKGIADIFVQYSPHVEWLEVTVYAPKWGTGNSPNVMFNISEKGVYKRTTINDIFGIKSSYEDLLSALEEYEDVD
jgi:hypothetical protein